MHRIFNNSKPFVEKLFYKQIFKKNACLFSFQNLVTEKGLQIQFQLRSIVKLNDLKIYIEENKEDIIRYGKTIILEYFNQYPMQSYKRSRDQVDMSKRIQKASERQGIYSFLSQLKNLNIYQLNLRYTIFNKFLTYSGYDKAISQIMLNDQTDLVQIFKKCQGVDIIDSINLLYMLPVNYKLSHSKLALDVIQRQISNPNVLTYLGSQRSLPVLIKRIWQQDWSVVRKYKNILYFITHIAVVKTADNSEQLVLMLQRIAELKLHQLGQKAIPKLIDCLMEKFQKDFSFLNKQSILKIFSAWRFLPLSYNQPFFNKIHNYLKATREQLPSHMLVYLPYNKLTVNEVSFLQTKMFSIGRQDIALKMIYTIYKPENKFIFTPFLTKQVYNNMIDIWNKTTVKLQIYHQIYVALIFKLCFDKGLIVNQSKLRNIFMEINYLSESKNYSFFYELSFPGMINFLQLRSRYKIQTNQKIILDKLLYIIRSRKQKNSSQLYRQYLLQAIKTTYMTTSRDGRFLLTHFYTEINSDPESTQQQLVDVLFYINKTSNTLPKWEHISNLIINRIMQDPEVLTQLFLKFEYKCLKLTNFIFTLLIEHNVKFKVFVDVVSGLNLKLITSLKGKLLTPLRKYILQMNPSQMELQNINLNSLIMAYRLLSYFRNQISEFLEFFTLKLIQKLEERVKNGQYINGKSFTSFCNYSLQNTKNINFQQKTKMINSLIQIMKSLRKKEGIFLKVYQLSFLFAHQKYIKINKQVLDIHYQQVLDTLKHSQKKARQYSDIYLMFLKLHSLQYIQLSNVDLNYFKNIIIELVDQAAINLTRIKQNLGYDILESQNPSQIQKLKLIFTDIVKLAFRKQKNKLNFFIYQYYMQLFSKLEQKDIVAQICQKLLIQKRYPAQISNIVPILNKNQIKNKKIIDRILQIITLGDSYVSFQKMQVFSWLQKINYQISPNNLNLTNLQKKIHSQMIEKTNNLKQDFKNKLISQQRSQQQGFQINDQNFDKNYKNFIQYAWLCIKNKQIYSAHFKFICRNLFFGIQKIKARIQNPIQRKQISKIKLFHVLKYLKDCGFFSINQSKNLFDTRNQNPRQEKNRKAKLLMKIQKQLNIMKIQECTKLEERLNRYSKLLQWRKKSSVTVNQNKSFVVQYLVQEIDNIQKKPVQYVIHTIKKYHITPQNDYIGDLSKQTSDKLKLNQQQGNFTGISKKPYKIKQKVEENSQKVYNDAQIDKILIDNNYENDEIQLTVEQIKENNQQKAEVSKLGDDMTFNPFKESMLSLELQTQKTSLWKTEEGEKKEKIKNKPMFGLKQLKNQSQNKVSQQKIQQNDKTKIQQTLNQTQQHKLKITSLPLQENSSGLYRDYNGYLKVQKSLIELGTGLKCILYDPEKDIFFY